MSDMPDDVYKKYTIGNEYSLFVELDSKKPCNSCQKDNVNCSFINASSKCYYCNDYGYECKPPNDGKTSNISIDGKTWSFTYSPFNQTLGLEMSMHSSDKNKTVAAELIFWYCKDQEIAIIKKTVHSFGVDSRKISVSSSGITPVNKKLNIVIRFLGERISSENYSLESYYGDYEGVETVTLCVAGTEKKKTSFVVPKYVLMHESPVFRRMFINEMTEKTTGKVDIKDTNPEEFGDFLKAISPKQEHPNPSNVFALLKLADRYQVKSLRDRCETHLMKCVEIPLVNLLTCANFYRLKKLKTHLLMSIKGTSLYKLYQQSKPHLGMLNLLCEMDNDE